MVLVHQRLDPLGVADVGGEFAGAGRFEKLPGDRLDPVDQLAGQQFLLRIGIQHGLGGENDIVRMESASLTCLSDHMALPASRIPTSANQPQGMFRW